MKRSVKAGLILMGLIVCIMGAWAVIQVDNGNYQEKMEILYTILAEGESEEGDLSLVTGILKGNKAEEMHKAREQLEGYGYAKDFENVYRKGLVQRRVLTIFLAAAIWGVYVIAIYLAEAACRKKSESELDRMKEVISGIISGADAVYLKKLFPDGNYTDDAGGKLWMELESLAFYVAMTKEQSAVEKEETKALVTDISHQLKNPVAALKTSFEILGAKDLSPKERSEFEARCGLQMIRLEELVAALVNISRMEKGMIVIKKENCRIFDTVVLAMNRVYQNAQEKQIEISVEAEAMMQERVIVHDPKWLAEAIINLLENAIKYSPFGSAITIRLIQMSMFLRIEIEDEGIGVPKKERNLIFRRFYRGQSEEVQVQQGSGVGLFLARKILELHGGTLTVTAPKGKEKGSLFVMQVSCENA